jgi:hypothetical protein
MASNNNSGNVVALLIPTHHLVVVRHDRHLNTIKVPLITDESFDDYVPTTTDPGSLLLIIAMFICGISLFSLPICTRLLTKQSRLNIIRRKNSSRMKKKKMTRDCGCVTGAAASSLALDLHYLF